MKRDPRKAFEARLVELAKKDERIYALSCDSASGGGLGAFFKELKERTVEVGISEQNAVGIAAAMSREGLIPVLVIITPFLTMRAYEQVRDDIGYMNSNVKIVGSGGGLAYSNLGSTHIAIEDVALMRTIPHLTILSPCNADEVEEALEQALAIDGPVYIRMPRQAREDFEGYKDRKHETGVCEPLTEGEDAVLFCYGPSTDEAYRAAAILKEKGVGLQVVDMMTVEPLDKEGIKKYAAGKRMVFTMEEHIERGGLGSAVAEVLAAMPGAPALKTLAIPVGSKMTGPYPELLAYYGLDAAGAAETIFKALSL